MTDAIKEKIIEKLRTVFDPEVPINIYDMGLIYDLQIDGPAVNVTMTFTSIACPAGPLIEQQIKEAIASLGMQAKINIVWEPAWSPEKMSDAAKAQLGI